MEDNWEIGRKKEREGERFEAKGERGKKVLLHVSKDQETEWTARNAQKWCWV